ncbi:MAG: DMT family protein [Chthoniobacterales bacterium]|jgi:uncharacterized protein (DUF486 family)|nr:DMT family protein [Chthoniobacterales bacterium]
MKTILLLTMSNAFVSLAWYAHLKFKDSPIWIVILESWGIAFFYVSFRSRRTASARTEWSVPELKVLQGCITLAVFTIVAYFLFRTPRKWNICVAYALRVGTVFSR